MKLVFDLLPFLLDTGVQVDILNNNKIIFHLLFQYHFLTRSDQYKWAHRHTHTHPMNHQTHFNQVWNSLEINEMITDPSSGYNYEGGLLFGDSPSIHGTYICTRVKLNF